MPKLTLKFMEKCQTLTELEVERKGALKVKPLLSFVAYFCVLVPFIIPHE